MSANSLLGVAVRIVASSKQLITDAVTTAFDFGTPDNLYLPDLINSGERVALVVTTTTSGNTSAITVVVQDADDSSGSIGTPATALTDGTKILGTGDKSTIIGVRGQSERPWLKVSLTSSSAVDDVSSVCLVLAVPAAL